MKQLCRNNRRQEENSMYSIFVGFQAFSTLWKQKRTGKKWAAQLAKIAPQDIIEALFQQHFQNLPYFLLNASCGASSFEPWIFDNDCNLRNRPNTVCPRLPHKIRSDAAGLFDFEMRSYSRELVKRKKWWFRTAILLPYFDDWFTIAFFTTWT